MTGRPPSWSSQAARCVSRGCTRSQEAAAAIPYRVVSVLVVTWAPGQVAGSARAKPSYSAPRPHQVPVILTIRTRLLVDWCDGRAGKLRMQEEEGKTSRQKITNRGKQTRNSRVNRADRRGQSRRCRERAEGHRM
jgi:hypothetical protein